MKKAILSFQSVDFSGASAQKKKSYADNYYQSVVMEDLGSKMLITKRTELRRRRIWRICLV
jgi:hypothetical protein